MRETDSISRGFHGSLQIIMLIFGSDLELTAWHVPVHEGLLRHATAIGIHLAAWVSGFGSKRLVAKHQPRAERMHATGRMLQFTVGAWGDCAGPETASRIRGPRAHVAASRHGIKPNLSPS